MATKFTPAAKGSARTLLGPILEPMENPFQEKSMYDIVLIVLIVQS
jgi:hypothetical protein